MKNKYLLFMLLKACHVTRIWYDFRKYSKIQLKKVFKQNRIKRVQCNANKSLNSNSSEKEMSLKQKLEESIRKFFEFYDNFSNLSRVTTSNRWASREAKGKNRWHCFGYYWQDKEIGRNLLKKSQRERVFIWDFVIWR